MILAFPAWRRGYFKVTGSVIDAALKRGHGVRLLWHEHSGKPGEDVLLTEVAARWPKAVVERIEPNPGAKRICALQPWRVIGPSLHAMAEVLPCAAGVKVSLDYAWEQITTPAAALRGGGHFCYVTEYQRAMHTRLLDIGPASTFSLLAPRQHITGSTMLDAFDVVRPDDVRARYCLPHGQPVVLFMALKFNVPHAWRRWWYRYTGYHRLVRAVRRYCDDSGALLVVKTRAKNLDPWFLRHYADRYVADEDLWPYTSAQLMSVAGLCIHFQSGAAIEAARAGVPQLSVRVPQPHLAGYPGHAEVYGIESGMQNWPGVVVSVGAQHAGWNAMACLRFALQYHWSPSDPVYLGRFCGPPNAAERVLDLVEWTTFTRFATSPRC